jgi:hypothetical protein
VDTLRLCTTRHEQQAHRRQLKYRGTPGRHDWRSPCKSQEISLPHRTQRRNSIASQRSLAALSAVGRFYG